MIFIFNFYLNLCRYGVLATIAATSLYFCKLLMNLDFFPVSDGLYWVSLETS